MKKGFLLPKERMVGSSKAESSCSTSASENTFSSLPVVAMKERIVEKILENPVTLIVGETGCGKSSQVPQFLLEKHVEPILCTQPRRFAVVAVAKMVAKARNCEVGEEVGYHIGHSKVLSSRSKIIFKTAGVLLEEMRDKGSHALNYKAIILDEVHERSVESDLVLACVKQFMLKNSHLRLVLMSATFDTRRYKDYFTDLGRGERVEVLAIPRSNQKTIYQRRVSYLEQITEILGTSLDLLPLGCFTGPSPSMANANINTEEHRLIHDLILHIHENEPDIEKSILVFLPTYQSLEQQWRLIKPLSSYFAVHILHRSIDTEQALMAMKICKSHRKVILATNIAESSVTIPKVAFVIDSCRSLQVFWDSVRKKDCVELIWVSKSQAEQRKGRTGRTCDGHIYRLVTGSFYNQLREYESPAILKLSLRQQVLILCCSESRAINDPRVLLQKVLDTPDPGVIEDALDLLVHMQALTRTSRGRYEPTYYGRLLASFSLSFDASVLILKFGDTGMLREGILFGILMDTQPLPIIRPFGEENLFEEYTDNFFGGPNTNKILSSRREVILMANLCPLQFWQHVFKDKYRLEHLKQLLMSNEMKAITSSMPKIEEEWCSFHYLLQPSLNHIAGTYEEILHVVHLFRPRFLGNSDGTLLCCDPYAFEHTCLLEFQPLEELDALPLDNEHSGLPTEARRCVAKPFVTIDQFQSNAVAEKLASAIKEVRLQSMVDAPNSQQHRDFSNFSSDINADAPLCVYFANGYCSKGSQCSFSHSFQAKRPACKFFFSLQGCRNGASCYFSHGMSVSEPPSRSAPTLLEEDNADATLLLQLFPSSDGCILLFDDTDLYFSSNVACFFDPSRIISTSSLSETTIFKPSLKDVRVFWGLQHPYQTIISNEERSPIPWEEVKCVLWFPNLAQYSADLDEQKHLVQNFFEYLAIRILADALYEVQVILTMNNFRFSQLQVEKLGRDCFFYLKESFQFDEASFGSLSDTVNAKKPMLVPKAVSYVFDLCPPSDVQFGDYASDYASVLRRRLHGIQGDV